MSIGWIVSKVEEGGGEEGSDWPPPLAPPQVFV